MSSIQSTLAPGLPVKFLLGDLYDNTKQYTDEAQLRGVSFNEKLDWLAGLFYLKSKPSGVGGNLVAFAAPLLTPSSGYNFIEQTSKAVFLNGKYDLGDFARVSNSTPAFARLGTRVNRVPARTAPDSCLGFTIRATAKMARPPSCTESDRYRHGQFQLDSVTWNIGFDWQIDPDLFTYISARKGYRAGGANGPTLSPGSLAPYQTFKPDTVTDVELGARSDMHIGDALLRSNVSVFSGWYDKVQLPLTGLTGPTADYNQPAGSTLLINAGETRVMGVDFAFTLVPNERWTIDVGGSLLKLDTINVNVADFLKPFLGDNPNELPFNNSAKKTFTSSVRYELPLGNSMGEMAFNLNYYFNGEMTIATQDIPSYGIFNGRIDWTHVAQSQFDISLFAKNLGDKEYISGGVAAGPGLGIETALVGAPRTYGVEARYHF